MSTGKQPFQGADTMSTLMAVAMNEPPAPNTLNEKLPPELSALVMKLLEKDPEKRLRTAREAVQALQAMEKKPALAHAPVENTETLQPPSPLHSPTDSGRGPRRRLIMALAAAVLLALLGGLVFYWQTNNGIVKIEINDPDVQVSFDKAGPTIKGVDKQDIKLSPGEYGLHIKRGDLQFDTDKFILKRGETITLRIEWFKDGNLQVVQGDKVIGKPLPKLAGTPVDDAWLKMVAALPADKQVEAVAAKLKDLNLGFDGKVKPEIEDEVVTELEFLSDNVTDLSPVRALTGLRALSCGGTEGDKRAPLSDLSPLKDMKLTVLHCPYTRVSDLMPLKSMKLEHLTFSNTPVADLTPLKDMPLRLLGCENTLVADLTPLKGMPLADLHCGGTTVSDLTPLKGMKLNYLTLFGTPVSDLTPLKDVNLTALHIGGSKVIDLTPLKDTQLTMLDCDGTKVSDLSPLKNLKLTELHSGNTQVTELTPLKNMKLTYLDIDGSPVADLSPLKGMKLETLYCADTKVTDLTLLKSMPLKLLNCDFKAERDAAILRSIKTLEKINDKEAKEFLKEAGGK